MLKKASALLISLALLGSVTACYMPDSIFPDERFATEAEVVETETLSIYNFKFNLDGMDYHLPMSYSAFSSRGWKLQGSEANAADDVGESDLKGGNAKKTDGNAKTETKVYQYGTVMKPGETSEYVPADHDTEYVAFKFYNDSKRERPLEECPVVGIMVEKGSDDLPRLIIDGDVELGGTYQDVVSTYGKPSYTKDVIDTTGELAAINDIPFVEDYDEESDELVRTLYYGVSDTSSVSFELGDYEGERDIVMRVKMENRDVIEEPYDYTKDIRSRPSIIRLYKGPNLLGKSFSDFAFKYEGSLYTLPIPVKVLVNDGWVFQNGSGERIPVGTTAEGLIMRKGNLAMRVLIHNYDMKKAQTAINCYAVSLSANVEGPNVKILMPKGVTLGSDYDELATAFGKEYKKLSGYVDPDRVVNGQTDEETEEEPEEEPVGTVVKYELEDDEGCTIVKTVQEEFTVYSYIMPDDVPGIPLPVSITDIKDPNKKLLGKNRKHIDVYMSNVNGKILKIYLQNCPEYVVDEEEVLEQQLAAAEKAAKEQAEAEKAEKEKAKSGGSKDNASSKKSATPAQPTVSGGSGKKSGSGKAVCKPSGSAAAVC